MMAYDLDTQPSKRKANPEFCGYIPDSSVGRTRAFVLLFLFHGAHVISRTCTVALLAQTNWRWLVAYLAADHSVFLLYKVVRRDLIFWMPGLGFALSVVFRIFNKIIADFTGARRSSAYASPLTAAMLC
jgi:hypothetical protein